MKVLQLISSSGPYGAEMMVMALTRQLQALGCDSRMMLVANGHRPDPQVRALAERKGCRPMALPCAGRFDRRAIRTLRAYLDHERIDVLHAHGYKARLYGRFAARHLPVALMTTCHGFVHDTLPLRLYDFVDRFVMRGFPRVATVSAELTAQLCGHGLSSSALTTIANGVDMEEYGDAQPTLRAELAPPGLLVGAVGRLSPEKGLGHFLRAAALVLRQFPDTSFALIGDGPQRADLMAVARELGIAEHVVFTGRRTDMAGVYASLDLVVLPSLQEGLPMVVLEAMASGRPLIASRVGDIGQVVTQGENGLLVPAGDSRALSAAMTQLLGDAVMRQRLGAAARVTVGRDYSALAMAKRYLEIYATLPSADGSTEMKARRAISSAAKVSDR